ncbi:uncharacterized protein LOC144065728 isoform X2 [Stigmatopora argus]
MNKHGMFVGDETFFHPDSTSTRTDQFAADATLFHPASTLTSMACLLEMRLIFHPDSTSTRTNQFAADATLFHSASTLTNATFVPSGGPRLTDPDLQPDLNFWIPNWRCLEVSGQV